MILLYVQVSLYSGSSVMDGGTMYQLRSLVNRRNVVGDPKDNEAACEDFMFTITDAHIHVQWSSLRWRH